MPSFASTMIARIKGKLVRPRQQCQKVVVNGDCPQPRPSIFFLTNEIAPEPSAASTSVDGGSSTDTNRGSSRDQESCLSWPGHAPTPEAYICPLTKRLMKHPVVDGEGNSYEKDAILKYLRRGRESLMGFTYSPITMSPLLESDLEDNMALQAAIDAWKRWDSIPVFLDPSIAATRGV